MTDFNKGVHGWSNSRGYGFLEFSDACNPNRITKLPTARLEPLTNAGPCTYLNKNSLTPTIKNECLKAYLDRRCTKDLCIPSTETVVYCQGNQNGGPHRSIRTKCLDTNYRNE